MAHRARRRAVTVLLGLLLLLGLGHGLYWYWVMQQLDAGLQAWSEQMGREGWTLTAAPPSRAGWPRYAELRLGSTALKTDSADVKDGIDWRSGDVRLRIDLFAPGNLMVLTTGPQRLRIGNRGDFDGTIASAWLSFPLGANASPALEAQVTSLSVARLSDQGTPSEQPWSIGSFWMRLTLQPNGTLASNLSGSQLDIPDQLPLGQTLLGPRIASAALAATLEGPWPDVMPTQTGMAHWRDGGGKLSIGKLNLAWGPTQIAADIVLGLDPELRPAGTGTVRIVGYGTALDALATSGLIERQAATALKFAMGLLARPRPQDNAQEVSLPIALSGGTLAVRGIPLARLPALSWLPP